MSDLKFNERELKTILYSLEDTIRTWGVDADGQVDEEIKLVKKIKESL